MHTIPADRRDCRQWPRLLPLLAILLLSACSLGPQRRGGPMAERNLAPGALNGWWSVAVTIHWPENTAPRFQIDALLADQVFRPLILAHETEMPLWRFHRRAARDQAGHRFRFLFYAPHDTAKAVFEALEADPLLRRLLKTQVIDAVTTDDVAKTWRPDRGAMGDPAWSPPINRAWPYFAMGVSKTWLSLIETDVGTVPVGLPIDALVHRYTIAEAKVREQWRDEGGHAFLHHLNALFGYEPIGIRF